MNKKILIIIIIVLAVVLVAGFFVFKYLSQIKGRDTQNSLGGANIENKKEEDKSNQLEVGGIKMETEGNKPGLIICADRCGDGVCQDKEPACKDNDLNCTCAENSQECPQDCK